MTLGPVLAGRIDYGNQVLHLVNSVRRDHGLAPLVMNPKLRRAALARATHMARSDSFSHDGWLDALRRVGWSLTRGAGENIAKGFDTAAAVQRAWMHSEAHRRNVLDPAFHNIGIARVEDIWVEIFGGR